MYQLQLLEDFMRNQGKSLHELQRSIDTEVDKELSPILSPPSRCCHEIYFIYSSAITLLSGYAASTEPAKGRSETCGI